GWSPPPRCDFPLKGRCRRGVSACAVPATDNTNEVRSGTIPVPLITRRDVVADGRAILKEISQRKNPETYRHEHWEGSFADYLDIVRERPEVTRNAFQRLYDMVTSYESTPIEGSKENLVRYSFFDDPDNDGRDAIFGLTKPLMELVNVFKSAALGYGSERR